MRFSIVVPAYNAQRWLGDCVASVFGQDFGDWELVLVDDGSVDGTGVMVDGYARRSERVVAIHQENAGQYLARRAGINRSSGDYLLFLDSDDELEPDALSLIDAILCERDLDLVLFHGRFFRHGMAVGGPIGTIAAPAGQVSIEDIRRAFAFSHSLNSLFLKAYRRDLFCDDDVDPLRFSNVRHAEDKAMQLRPLTYAQDCVYLPRALYRYRLNEQSVSHDIGVSDIPSLMGNEVFDLLSSTLPQWGLDTPKDRRLLGGYYLRNYIEVYFNLRRSAADRGELRELRRYPWRDVLERGYLRPSCLLTLSPRELFKYCLARLCA